MLSTPYLTCHRYQSRSIMQWCDQKIGSNADAAITPMSPPTQPWTPSWMFWIWLEKSSNVVAPLRIACTVASDGSAEGGPGLRVVRGGGARGGRGGLARSAGGTGRLCSAPLAVPDVKAAGRPFWCDTADVQSHHGS